jgi:tetratricopeptide (TPR) repeat protein
MSQEVLQNEKEEVVETVEVKGSNKSEKSYSFGALEVFYEKNKQMVTYVGGGLLAIIVLFSAYKFYWLPAQETEAQNEAYIAQSYFEKDSFNLALNGGISVQTPDGPKTMMGFIDIAESYSSTKVGNQANYSAGICLLRMGKYEEAISYLEKFDGSDEMLAPVAVGAIGDANMELNKLDLAIKYYLKAAEKSSNSFTTPIYLKKAALAYELNSNFNEALATYERLKSEYPKSSESRDVEKYIARVKASGNID